MIQVDRLEGGYGNNAIIKDVTFEIKKGQFFALLGPNGSGKSTLLKLLTGILPPKHGKIQIDGKPLTSYSSLEKAKTMTVLSQEVHVSFDFTVEEIISLGRYPHQRGLLKSLSPTDYAVINEVMKITNTKHYQHTPFHSLSGGEKQRVLLAKALAQEPKILLLDEPTNHLDVKHTFDMLNLLKDWMQNKKLTVFAILHDLNVASLYADQVALLHEGQMVEIGDVDVLKNEEQLEKVYQVQIKTQGHPSIPKPQMFLTPDYGEEAPVHSFEKSFQVTQDEEQIHIQFNHPLRTISNGVIGEGIQWVQHFCNFHVDKSYNCSDPQADVREWMRKLQIPPEQAVGMMTAVQLNDAVFLTKKAGNLSFMVMVTAGVGNAVDISRDSLPEKVRRIGTINTMVFIDGHLTDGALVNALMSATEAKTKALNDLKVKDKSTGTIATGTSTDSLLIASTQVGESTPYAGSGTVVGKGIGQIVYEATQVAIHNYHRRIGT